MGGYNKQQFEFTYAVSQLIQFAYMNGYTLSMGDAWSKPEYEAHSRDSKHYNRLAIDLNLFKDGKFLQETSDHEPLGRFWESIGGTWGGDFPRPDGNHYSWNET